MATVKAQTPTVVWWQSRVEEEGERDQLARHSRVSSRRQGIWCGIVPSATRPGRGT